MQIPAPPEQESSLEHPTNTPNPQTSSSSFGIETVVQQGSLGIGCPAEQSRFRQAMDGDGDEGLWVAVRKVSWGCGEGGEERGDQPMTRV